MATSGVPVRVRTVPDDVKTTGKPPSTADLAQAIHDLARADDDYWSFADRGERDYLHGLFRYPAMMVPRLQRELLRTCLQWNPDITSVYDPFVGSGTVMTETMLVGRDFIGTDINPLAILTCRAKSEFLSVDSMSRDLKSLMNTVDADDDLAVDISFSNIGKWFEPHVLVGLSKLRRGILGRPSVRARRFWWAVLAEVIRVCSNSRTSTVKLHIRPDAEIESRPDPVSKFRELANRGLDSLSELADEIRESGFVNRGRYGRNVELRVADTRATPVRPAGMLMTSPPYGDNHTTVTYGQSSFLPLQWIPLSDIGRGIDPALVANTHAIDTASLGGRRGRSRPTEDVLDKSPTLRLHYDRLATQPRDRQQRVLTFFTDMDRALDRIADNVLPGAPMLWTVGDRSVGGERIPLGTVISQLLGARAEFVTQLDRTIPAGRKRMPSRNALTGTMASETILVVRRTAEAHR